jgi:multimeric flavodoxin WrbA
LTVLILLGSRNPNGQTAKAAHALLEGLTENGIDSEMVFLPELRIERCRQCRYDGWGMCVDRGECVIEDDFSKVVEKLRASDGVVFATPVYWSDLSESLRAFLDRLRRICMHDQGRFGIKEKAAVGICVAGGGGGGAPQCCRNMEWILQTTGFNVVDLIPVRRQNLEAKLPILKETGRYLSLTLRENGDTMGHK